MQNPVNPGLDQVVADSGADAAANPSSVPQNTSNQEALTQVVASPDTTPATADDTLPSVDALSTVGAEEPQATFLGGSDLSAQAIRSHVTLYEDSGFKGALLDLTGNTLGTNPYNTNLNYYYISWPYDTWNNATSSLVVGPHTQATFYAALGLQGTHHTLGPGTYDLAALNARGIPNDWISSVSLATTA